MTSIFFVAKDYRFVLRLSKTSYRVKKHMFAQSVFMKGMTNSTYHDEFDLITGMIRDQLEGCDLLDIVKGKVNKCLANVGSGGI